VETYLWWPEAEPQMGIQPEQSAAASTSILPVWVAPPLGKAKLIIGHRRAAHPGRSIKVPPIASNRRSHIDIRGGQFLCLAGTGAAPDMRPFRVLPENWEPVFRKEARQNKELGSVQDSIETGQTLDDTDWTKRPRSSGRGGTSSPRIFRLILAFIRHTNSHR
jgi:hypothetical protein